MLKITKTVGIIWFFTIAALFSLYWHASVQASINSCSASVSPSSLAPGTGLAFNVSVNNSSANDIQWIDISIPSPDFLYGGNSIGDWTTSDHSDGTGTTLTDSTLAAGNSEIFSVAASAGVANVPAENWQVKVSDDPGGANPFTCSGNLGTSINGNLPNDSDNGVSSIVLSNLTSTSVTVGWQSDTDTTSLVYYGKTSSYGSWTNHNKTSTSSHSVNLTGLSPNTTYHFQVAGQDSSFNAYYSADNTFITAPAQVSSGGGSNPSSSFINTPVPIKSKPTEKVPPTIQISSKLDGVFKSAPAISGTASDNEAVAAVEYSIDGGKNWLPVDASSGLGTKNASFSFTPHISDDGNYQITARAVDTSGNTAQTITYKLILDQLPPLVGGSVLSIGPQVIYPAKGGVISSLVNVNQKITLSAVGGPTSIILSATDEQAGQAPINFPLTQSEDTGLWSGHISFKAPGLYKVTANSVDGAGNKTSKEIGVINASAASQLLNSKTQKPAAGKVTLYSLQPDTNTWTVWDAQAYGQQNPQATKADGKFSLFLPAGKYYLKISAKGYKTINTKIFNLTQPTPIIAAITLKPGHDWRLGPINLSGFNLAAQKINLKQPGSQRASTSSTGKHLPTFALSSSSGQTVRDVDLLGKPSVITFLSLWSPVTNEQLPALQSAAADKDVNVVPLGLQENASRVRAFDEISGYSLNWLVDPNSITNNSFPVNGLPTHYFVDRNGTIKQVVSGILSQQQILNDLSNL